MFRQLFTSEKLKTDILNYFKNNKKELINSLFYLGEELINEARVSGTYTDRTGNLRSSVGYVIFVDGEKVNYNLIDKSGEAEAEAKDFINSIIREEPMLSKGVSLVFFAGMEYALYVEAKGYDVISGSIPEERTVIKTLMSDE